MSIRIVVGDCRQTLKTLPDQSVHTCVTSPPYFGLRDYGHGEQIGLESTPDAFVAQLVAVFREVKRVLRDDGTLWLNLGDSYARPSAKGGSGVGGKNERYLGDNYGRARADTPPGLKPKDLIGIPWRVAFALQADGWYLRSDIIWAKPNPMPESVTDRPTKAHEYIFLLSKSERYFYDSAAILEPHANGGEWIGRSKANHKDNTDRADGGRRATTGNVDGRNRRSVWTVPTSPYKGAHFATFPPALIEPCILAGCPKEGTVLDPFGGAGTTGLVADRHGRSAILCELNQEYATMAYDRIVNDLPMFASVDLVTP